MKIYLIGSLRNPNVPETAKTLRLSGLDAFDDWYGAGNEADDKWQQYENQRGRSYAEALAGAAAQNVFNFDKTNIDSADGVLLVLPAGKSGHLEFGYARGIGKAAVILLDGEPERFDVMYNFAHLVTNKVEEAVAFFKDWKTPESERDIAADVINPPRLRGKSPIESARKAFGKRDRLEPLHSNR